MILALERVTESPDLYLLLCEVSSEEEAFAEMRRFLYVNHIFSNLTSVEMVEEGERRFKLVPKHKEVWMVVDKDHKNEFGDKGEGAIFHIYYDSDRPRREVLGSLEEWGLREEFDSKTGNTHLFYDVKCVGGEIITYSGKWYKYIKRYLEDLAMRKAGDL